MQQITSALRLKALSGAALLQGAALQHALFHIQACTQQVQHTHHVPAWNQLPSRCSLHNRACHHFGPLMQPCTSPPHQFQQTFPQQQFQQLRRMSADSEVARQRLVAAHQRRQRDQELQRRREEGLAEAAEPSSSSTELQDVSSTAVVPQESPPAEVQVRFYGRKVSLRGSENNFCENLFDDWPQEKKLPPSPRHVHCIQEFSAGSHF